MKKLLSADKSCLPRALQYFLATSALNWYFTPVTAYSYMYWIGLEFDGLLHRWLDGNSAGDGAVYNDNPYAHFGYRFQVRHGHAHSIANVHPWSAAHSGVFQMMLQVSRRPAWPESTCPWGLVANIMLQHCPGTKLAWTSLVGRCLDPACDPTRMSPAALQDARGANPLLACTSAQRSYRYDQYIGNSTEYLQWQDVRNFARNTSRNKWGW